MKELNKLFDLYKKILLIHIRTKTLDKVFHEFTGEVYEKAFDVFHHIGEKMEDIEIETYDLGDCDQMKNDVYDYIEEIKSIVDEMRDQYSTGMDDLVRSLVNDLESLCGTARGFMNEEMEEYEEEMPAGTEPEPTPVVKKIKPIINPLRK